MLRRVTYRVAETMGKGYEGVWTLSEGERELSKAFKQENGVIRTKFWGHNSKISVDDGSN